MPPIDDQIAELVERWGDLRAAGSEISIEELCRDCPELTDEVRHRIEALKATEWLERPDDRVMPPSTVPVLPEHLGLPSHLGRYELKHLIGAGGFGWVWKAFDPELNRAVAIKVNRPETFSTTGQAQAFLAEARRIARLRHPGILPIYDVGLDGDRCYLVTEFVDGGSLADRISSGPVSPRRAALLVAQVADSLHHAHNRGIIHRDIKPDNILIREDETPVLADFGIAFHEGAARRGQASTEGTLWYMSPEQVRGDLSRIDARSDIYCLGVVLYELLTGTKPFDASSPAHLREDILAANAKPPRSMCAAVPLLLDRACLTAMAKDPANRYPTAKDFAAALRDSVGEPRPSRWKRYAVLAAIAILPFVAVGVWLLRGYQESQRTAATVAKSTQDKVAEFQDKLEKSVGLTLAGQPVQPATQRTGSGSTVPLRLAVTEYGSDLTGRPVTLEDFKVLGRQMTLQRLILADTPTTDDCLSYLSSSVMLEELDLRGTRITDLGLKHLSSLSYFRYLDLSNTNISDAGLKALAEVRIRRLSLCRTKVTDAGIVNISNPYGPGGYLTDLDLRETAVTDACVEQLRKMRLLDTLDLRGTKVTEAAVDALKQALPKCVITR